MEAFLQKAHEVHKDRYNYEKVKYVNNSTKVTITCAEHGDFQIRPVCHTSRKQGCAECGRNSRVDTEVCLSRLQAVFGERYQYDKVVYKDAETHIRVVCETHGEFSRTPQYLIMQGLGCPKCGEEGNGIPWSSGEKKERMCKDNFLALAREIHGDKYNYEKTEYKLALEKVTITCSTHGDFQQTPSMHISGKHGCHQCAGTSLMTTQSFIEKALQKNPGKPYDYSPVDYKGIEVPITIICKSHGPFQVKPAKHLSRGDGCHKCHGDYSRQSIAWLEYVSKTDNIEIQHAENGGEKDLVLNGKRYQVDGFCEATNTVFQYQGDMHHGNPKKYKAEDLHPLNKRPFGELYKKTLEIEGLILRSYNLVVMWETEWLAKCKTLGIDPAATCSNPDYGRQTKEHKREYHRQWREKNRTAPRRVILTEEQRQQYQRDWREKNRDKLQAAQKRFQEKKRARILAQKEGGARDD